MTVDIAKLRALRETCIAAGAMLRLGNVTAAGSNVHRPSLAAYLEALSDAAPEMLEELEVLRVVSERSKAWHDTHQADLERLRRLEAAVLARADAETAAGFAHEGTDWRPAFERCRVAKQAERAAISEARAAREKASG